MAGRCVPKVYAVALVVTAAMFWLFSAPDPGAGKSKPPSLRQQLAVLRDPRVWKYCQYYSIVFGGFTALSIWMPQYFKRNMGLRSHKPSLLAACFSLPGGVLRAVGGWLSDRFGAHDVTWWVLWAAWICLFLLSYPRTELIVHTIDGPVQLHASRCRPWFFTAPAVRARHRVCLRHGVDVQVYRRRFPDNMGVVSGIVGMAGGLGGFLLPIMFGAILDWLGDQFELLHAALRHRLGVVDPELSDRGAQAAGHGRETYASRDQRVAERE